METTDRDERRERPVSRRSALRAALGGGAAVAGAAVAARPARAANLNPGWREGDPTYVGQKGRRWAMLIDLRKCIGCQACTVACKFENNVPDGRFRTWVPDVELGTYPNVRRAFLPRLCNHCERPSCIEVCPAGATWQRRDGIVEIDHDLCWGCGACVDACPYDARFIDPVTKTADKCTFCTQRVDQGLLPACVESCVGDARQFGDLNDPESVVARAVAQDAVQVLKPGTGNEPRVFYIALPDALQNNLPGRPTLWSDDRRDNGTAAPDAEWWLESTKEAEHV